MSEPRKKRVSPAAPRPEDMPSLRAFWEELKRHCGTDGEAARSTSGSSGHARGSARGSGLGSRGGSRFGSRSGSRFGDEEDTLGYGLGLIAPDASAEARVQMILHMLVAQDAAREKQRKRRKRKEKNRTG
ncbi:MAG: hypothetical protein IJQ98_13310 [Oscillospiraceae bacterium]|nr:hypothetical protein [Oscillospiraceae bacterium]